MAVVTKKASGTSQQSTIASPAGQKQAQLGMGAEAPAKATKTKGGQRRS